MNEANDDDLGIDLAAWQVPEPPSGIADAVIARMATTHVGAPPVEPEPRRVFRRRWLFAGGIGAATAAALAVVFFGVTRAPERGNGVVDGAAPYHLPLGASSADVDGGARIEWQRDGDRVVAMQRRGAATWSVGDDDTVTIDAGLASIAATDARLRVEVTMRIDRSTKQTIATSAATAAAVALVTVIVYDGVVKVTEHGGKTQTVPAGVAYQVRTSGPNEFIDEQATVGAAPAEIAEPKREIGRKDAEIAELERRRAERDATMVDPFAVTKTPKCDADRLRQEGREAFAAGRSAHALAKFEEALACAPDAQTRQFAFASACKAKNLAKARVHWRSMAPSQRTNVLSICVINGILEDELDALDGKLRITATPNARVVLDGKPVGMTPLVIPGVAPGKHKVQFVVGDDKYTFSVVVKAGETAVLAKDLQ